MRTVIVRDTTRIPIGRQGEIIIPSSTAGSTKEFKLTMDDTGAVSATEVTT